MPIGTLVGFNLATLLNHANLVTVPVVSGGAYVTMRLSSGAAATITLYQGGTNATNRISRLQTGGAGADETSVPLRISGTVKVQLSTTASSTIGFVYIR